MKVGKIYTTYTGQIDVGKLALFIELDNEGGVNKSFDFMETKVVDFDTVVFKGDVVQQIADVSKLINKVSKDNKIIKFILNVDSKRKLLKITKYDNITINVNVMLSKSELPYEERISEKDIEWYNNMKCNFIFDVLDIDDIDEVKLLMDKFGINKRNIYLSPIDPGCLSDVLELAKFNGYNFAPDFKRFLWEE